MLLKAKRLLATAVSLLFILVMIAGCGQSGTTQNQTTSKNESASSAAIGEEKPLYVVKVLSAPRDIKSSEETETGKYIKEKFGIVFEYISYTGDLREKQNIMLAAGEYDEIQYMQREDTVMKYINAGVLLDLDQYLDKMPDFQKRFEDVIPYWRLPGQGKLYKWETFIPRRLPTDIEVNDVMVRSDALEKQGWKAPLSADEWVAFLKQAVKDLPEVNGQKTVGMTLPLAEPWGLAGIAPIMYEKSDKYSPVSNEGYTYNLQTGKFEDYFTNPYVKESYQFFNKLFREGLLDEECFTDTADKTVEKLRQGRAISSWYLVWETPGANTELVKNGHPEMQYVNLPVQSNTSVANKEKRQIRVETTRPFDSYGITKNARYPERLAELINWSCTDEGQIILRSGLEGTHWNKVDGKRVPTEAFTKAILDNKYNDSQGLGKNYYPMLPSFNLTAADGQPHDLSADPVFRDEQTLSDRQKEAYKNLGWKSSLAWYEDNGFFAETGLAGSITIDPATDTGKVHQKMTELRVKNSAKLIMAKSDEEFEKVYQAAMDEYKKLNPQEVINEYNKLLEEKKQELEKYK